jgi:hypothetical protein
MRGTESFSVPRWFVKEVIDFASPQKSGYATFLIRKPPTALEENQRGGRIFLHR